MCVNLPALKELLLLVDLGGGAGDFSHTLLPVTVILAGDGVLDFCLGGKIGGAGDPGSSSMLTSGG